MGNLYLVATPIGNLEDMSPRAVRVLQQVSLIAAEDTRRTRTLLTHFGIRTHLISFYEHNQMSRLDAILSALAKGDVALVSDAGTPVLNDPGYELVRAALEAGHEVSPVPGPSAPLAALIASGLPAEPFLYLGFLPHKAAERRARLQQVADLPYTLIFFETPHDLRASLPDLETVLGDRQMAVARELTKLHEQIWRGTISTARQYFTRIEPRGEFTLVIAGQAAGERPHWSEDNLTIAIKMGLKLGESPSKLAKRVAEESGWERREVYKRITSLLKE